jgi:hypothetical protein
MKYPLIAETSVPKIHSPEDFGYPTFKGYSSGIDLCCSENTQVQAIEAGIVLNIKEYSGKNSNNPWWNSTKSVFVEGESGVIVYSGISPQQSIYIGGFISEGEIVGIVKALFSNKVMLNVQNYKMGNSEFIHWMKKQEQPEELINPRLLLNKILYKMENS